MLASSPLHMYITAIMACQQEVQILVESYGNFFESAFGSAEIYIITECTHNIVGQVNKILEFYNINPNEDIPEYSDAMMMMVKNICMILQQ